MQRGDLRGFERYKSHSAVNEKSEILLLQIVPNRKAETFRLMWYHASKAGPAKGGNAHIKQGDRTTETRTIGNLSRKGRKDRRMLRGKHPKRRPPHAAKLENGRQVAAGG